MSACLAIFLERKDKRIILIIRKKIGYLLTKQHIYMKKRLFFAFCTVIIATIACKKDDTPAATPSPYMSISANSSWQFRTVNNRNATTTNYSLTSTSRDSVINTKSYHIFTNSVGSASEYYLISGNDYYNFRDLGASLGNNKVEVLYLKDNAAVGATWSQSQNLTIPSVPFPVPVTLTFTVVEKGVSKTVNGVSYTDVIHVKTDITSSLTTTGISTDIHNYYAPKVGVIETTNKVNISFGSIADTTDTKTILLSSDIR
jgi:hypothetical protein